MSSETQSKRPLDLSGKAVTKKVLTIVGLTAALVIPLFQIENQIYARRDHETVAQVEVKKGWGDGVTLNAPSLTLARGKVHFPDTAETTINVDSREKKRGVFKVPVYVATLRTKISYARQGVPLNDDDRIFLQASPVDSIQSFKVKSVKTSKTVKSHVTSGGIFILPEDLSPEDRVDPQLEIEITIRGTDKLIYNSSSLQDQVTMRGNWTKPKFIEDVFPGETKLSSDGFQAIWSLNGKMSRPDGTQVIRSIGLQHLWIGTDYIKTERAVKYGSLFIMLTFLLVFVVEFMSHVKIHPLQYGLIGLSISLFYLLLLAISEKIGFDLAYIASSLSVTILLWFYIRGFLNQKKFVRMILAEQMILSGFFYLLLSLEESAFLIGSLGLFVALAGFMIITRKFDWYSGSFEKASDSQKPTDIALSSHEGSLLK